MAEDKAYVNRIQMELDNHLVLLVLPSLFSISREKLELEYIWTFDLGWGPIDRFSLAAFLRINSSVDSVPDLNMVLI